MCTIDSLAHIKPIDNFNPSALEDIGRTKRNRTSN